MNADYLPCASLDVLRTRARMLAQTRKFFDDRGFLEVETPLLSHDAVIDRHLDPLAVTLFADPREPTRGPQLWLQTSPEFGMKRLLVGITSSVAGGQIASIAGGKLASWGAALDRDSPSTAPGGRCPPAFYQVCKAFRGGEVGALHNPEFTMLEWYRVGDDYAAGMQLLADFAEELLPFGAPERISYREAFLQHAGVDPLDLTDLERDQILVTQVEPHLGQTRPTIVYDYPASQAALARVRDSDPPVAERFELYVRGIELANGYHELLDPAVLRERNRRGNEERQSDGKFPLPAESRLLAAMDHGLPPCAGTALGFDRLVMVASGAKSLQDVLAFPIDIA